MTGVLPPASVARLRLIAAAAIGLFAVFVPTAPAAGCSGGPLLAPGQTYESIADVIFTGTAVRVDDPRSALDGTRSSMDPMAWTFAVDLVEKGDVGARFTITTPRWDASCGFRFSLGSRYRVLAWGSVGGPPQVLVANGTDIRPALPNPPRVEGSFAASGFPLPPSIEFAALVAALFLVVLVVVTRRLGWRRGATA